MFPASDSLIFEELVERVRAYEEYLQKTLLIFLFLFNLSLLIVKIL